MISFEEAKQIINQFHHEFSSLDADLDQANTEEYSDDELEKHRKWKKMVIAWNEISNKIEDKLVPFILDYL